MGEILQLECSKCGYHIDLFVGGGRGDCNPETAVAAMNHDACLADALKDNTPFWIERRAAICKKCRKLTIAVQVEYQKANAPKQSIKNVCPDCSGTLLPIAPNVKMVPCPACNGFARLDSAGHWD